MFVIVNLVLYYMGGTVLKERRRVVAGCLRKSKMTNELFISNQKKN